MFILNYPTGSCQNPDRRNPDANDDLRQIGPIAQAIISAKYAKKINLILKAKNPGKLPGGGFEGLREKLKRSERWTARSQKTADFLKKSASPEDKALSGKLDACGRRLCFRHYPRSKTTSLYAGNFCNLRYLCPACGSWQATKTTNGYCRKYAAILAQNPDLVAAMVTYTIRNTEDLPEGLSTLLGARGKMGQKVHDEKRGCGKTELSKAVGGVVSVEIKRGKNSGLWHAHIHELILLKKGNWIDQKELSREWAQATGDGSWNLSVTKLRGDSPEEMRKSFAEIFKYTVKMTDLSPEDNLTAHKACRGKHLIRPWGKFKRTKEEKEKDELFDIEEPIGDPLYVDLFYVRSDEIGKYKFVEARPMQIEPPADPDAGLIRRTLRPRMSGKTARPPPDRGRALSTAI